MAGGRVGTGDTVRTIVVGDIHGCIEEFDELLATTEFVVGVDRLVLLGDLMDRGPDPIGVVRRARQLGAEAVLGNHDEKHLRWRKHEEKKRQRPSYQNPMRPLRVSAQQANAALTEEDLAYLTGLPLLIRLESPWVAVHAGFVSGVAIDDQKAAVMLRIRYVDSGGRFVSISEDGQPPPGARPWPEHWRGPESVVYGHAVQTPPVASITEPAPGVGCIGIDTGCCFGGRLTALVFPSLQVVQVAAKQTYDVLDAAEPD